MQTICLAPRSFSHAKNCLCATSSTLSVLERRESSQKDWWELCMLIAFLTEEEWSKKMIIKENNEKLVPLSKCFQLLINAHCLHSLFFFSLQLQSQCSSFLATTVDLTVCQIITNSCSALCFSYFFKSIFSPFLEPDDLTPEIQLFFPKEEGLLWWQQRTLTISWEFSLLRQEKK